MLKQDGDGGKDLQAGTGIYPSFIKRVLDIFFALLAFILFFWLYALLALLVAVKMGRPVIYASDRIGKGDQPFRIYKFRSMTNDRDSEGVLLPGPQRMTSFGRFLRSTSLDELPSMWNILKGDMSLVGPRPLLLKYAPYFYPEERLRHAVRPGLSGWAQVKGRNLLSWEEKFSYDLYYVQHVSFLFDLKILLQTVLKVLRRSDIVQGKDRAASLHEARAHLAPDKED